MSRLIMQTKQALLDIAAAAAIRGHFVDVREFDV
jgi:homoaconitase/3-isopropylmalate dehydratase large subunit